MTFIVIGGCHLTERICSSKQEIRLLVFAVFLYFCLLMILAAVCQRFGWSNDYVGYKKIFTFEYGQRRESVEPFFRLLRYINDIYFSSALLPIYVFTALFSFCVKWRAFCFITGKRPYLIFFCHTLCFFWILEYTQIRASCAIAIFLCSIPDLANGKASRFLAKAVLATLFHYSAFLMLFFFIYMKIFKSKKWYVLLPVVGLMFAVLCNAMFGTRLREVMYLVESALGLRKSGNISDFMSPFNSKYLMLLVMFLINAAATPRSDAVNTVMMKSMSFGLCFYYWLNPLWLPVISVRLAEFYTSVFVLYFFLNIRNFRLKEKNVCRICVLVVAALYSVASIKTAIL